MEPFLRAAFAQCPLHISRLQFCAAVRVQLAQVMQHQREPGDKISVKEGWFSWWLGCAGTGNPEGPLLPLDGVTCGTSSHCSEHPMPPFVSESREDFPALAVTSAEPQSCWYPGSCFFLMALPPDKSTFCGRDGLGRAVSGCVVMLKARLCQPLHQSWLGRD